MDIMSFVDDVIEFAKDKLDSVMDFWDDLEDDKKKLLVGCVAAAAFAIVIASIAYSIGKSKGERLALEEEDF